MRKSILISAITAWVLVQMVPLTGSQNVKRKMLLKPDYHASDSGTSMAAPHVADVATLVWEAKPELNNIELRDVLNESALRLGDFFYYGNGLETFNLIKQED